MLPTQTGPAATTPASPEVVLIAWDGKLKREQWNLFSLKVLTRLALADEVQIQVKVSAKLKEGQSVEQLNNALKELGVDGTFKAE